MESFYIRGGATARDLRQLIIDRDRLFYGLNRQLTFGLISGPEQFCVSSGTYRLLGSEKIRPGISMHTECAKNFGLEENFNARLLVVYIANGYVHQLTTYTVLRSRRDLETFNRAFTQRENRKGIKTFRYLILYEGLNFRNEGYQFQDKGKKVLFPSNFSFEEQEETLRTQEYERLQNLLKEKDLELMAEKRCATHGLLMITQQCECVGPLPPHLSPNPLTVSDPTPVLPQRERGSLTTTEISVTRQMRVVDKKLIDEFLCEFRKLSGSYKAMDYQFVPRLSDDLLEKEDDIARRLAAGEIPPELMDWGDYDYEFVEPIVLNLSFFDEACPTPPSRRVGLSLIELQNEELVREAIANLEQDVQEQDAYDLHVGRARPSITARTMMDKLLRYNGVMAGGVWVEPAPPKCRKPRKPPDKPQPYAKGREIEND
jgi:hypothetical protein